MAFASVKLIISISPPNPLSQLSSRNSTSFSNSILILILPSLATMPKLAHVLLALATSGAAYTDIRHKRFMIKNIDPIVFPGQYRSHMHSFYGSDVVTKDLPTTKQLQQGCPSGE